MLSLLFLLSILTVRSIGIMRRVQSAHRKPLEPLLDFIANPFTLAIHELRKLRVHIA